ncbi:MAG: Uncharacterized protein G01um101470_382 [Parcubacteria group bacterium Gr01-1014_70]|nr:MAG: Uncharacterized protein G01um101470_382 [Parcubacteria group bacterium Gr01-1014_70]
MSEGRIEKLERAELQSEQLQEKKEQALESMETYSSVEDAHTHMRSLERLAAALHEEGVEKVMRMERASGLTNEECMHVREKFGIREKMQKFRDVFVDCAKSFERWYYGKILENQSPSTKEQLMQELLREELDEAGLSGSYVVTQEETTLPIKPGEIFSAEQELQKIHRLPKEDRPQALKEFREKLAYQKERIAMIQERIIELIRKNPDNTLKDLKQFVRDEGSLFSLTPKYEKLAESMLKEYIKKHEEIRRVRREIPDDQMLYAVLFQALPKGRVEVIEGPMTLYFKCFNVEDYARIRSSAFKDRREINEQDIAAAKMSGGVSLPYAPLRGLDGTLIAENSEYVEVLPPDVRAQYSESVMRHEEQHAIYRLFNRTSKLRNLVNTFRLNARRMSLQIPADTEHMKQLALEHYVRDERKYYDEQGAKNEILAYYKQELYLPIQIASFLKQSREDGGIYDYFADRAPQLQNDLEHTLGEQYKGMIGQSIQKVFGSEYHKIVDEGVEAFARLQMEGDFTIDQTIALLICEPLTKWKKVADRLLEIKQKEAQNVSTAPHM